MKRQTWTSLLYIIYFWRVSYGKVKLVNGKHILLNSLLLGWLAKRIINLYRSKDINTYPPSSITFAIFIAV